MAFLPGPAMVGSMSRSSVGPKQGSASVSGGKNDLERREEEKGNEGDEEGDYCSSSKSVEMTEEYKEWLDWWWMMRKEEELELRKLPGWEQQHRQGRS